VKRFRYLGDPLFVGCCVLYAVNRFWVKPHTHNALMQFWFNDLLLIPCALPVVLQLQRCLGLRRNDRPPTFGEIMGHLVFWSVLFEVIGPHIMRHATGDPADVVAYAIGAAGAYFLWNRATTRVRHEF
jgi:hypothetical protein